MTVPKCTVSVLDRFRVASHLPNWGTPPRRASCRHQCVTGAPVLTAALEVSSGLTMVQ